jgi:hypothetical protein
MQYYNNVYLATESLTLEMSNPTHTGKVRNIKLSFKRELLSIKKIA